MQPLWFAPHLNDSRLPRRGWATALLVALSLLVSGQASAGGACGIYNTWYNATAGCPGGVNPPGNPSASNLPDTLPHKQQMGQFATFMGQGYGYVSSGTQGGTMVVGGIPAGATIVRAFLFQVGMYAGGNNQTGFPTTVNTVFNGGAAITGPVTGVGDFLTNWIHPVYGPDNNQCWNPSAYNARFDVTSKITGNGTYTLTQQPGSGDVGAVSSLVVIYADPADPDTGVVSLADGMFFWHPKPYNGLLPGLINDGNFPMPTTMDWSCAMPICDPASTRLTRIGATNDLNAHQRYRDQLLPPGTLGNAASYPAPRWNGPQGVLGQKPDVDSYANPPGGFLAGDTRLTWNLGDWSDSKTTYWVNALVFSHQCPSVNSAAATLTKSVDRPSTVLGETLTFNLHYQYNPVASGPVVVDNHNDNDGQCTPLGWSQGIPTLACFREIGGQAGNMNTGGDEFGVRQSIYNLSSQGTDGVLEVRLSMTQWQEAGLVFRYQGSDDNGYTLRIFNGDTNPLGNPDRFILVRGSTQIATWFVTPGATWITDNGLFTVRVVLSGCNISVLTNGPAGGGASGTFTPVGTVSDCTYASGFSGYWRANNNDIARFDNYSWTPACGSATSVVVRDDLPSTLCYLGPLGLTDPTSTGTSPGNLLTWNLGTLACGAAGDLRFTAVVCALPPAPACQLANGSSMSSASFATVNSNVVTVDVPGNCDPPTQTRTPVPVATSTRTAVPATSTPPPTLTRTAVPATSTTTPPPSQTSTAVPATSTTTPPPSQTSTVLPATGTTTPWSSPSSTVLPATGTTTPWSSPSSTVLPATAMPTPLPSQTATALPPVSTPTLSPSRTATRSFTATRTDTPTVTATPTQTLTSTITVTRTATRTDTPTSSVTATRTDTPTVTASPTQTLTSTVTATPTATRTATPTATVTLTSTPSVSHSATPTATPSRTDTPSHSPTLTWTETPVPPLYRVNVTLYNSAGEVVRRLYDGASQSQAIGIRTELLPTLVDGRLPIAIHIDGLLLNGEALPLVWHGDNDNGQIIDNGTYTLKVETVDSFGAVAAMTQAVSVLGNHGGNSLAIFNSAGELVRTIPLSSLPDGLVDFELRPGADAGGQGGLKFMIRGDDGVERPWSWDGRNDRGQPVASGSYLVRLMNTELGVGTTIKSLSVVLLQSPDEDVQATLASAVLGPNPWRGADAEGWVQLRYQALPGRQLRARAFNLAGELVAVGADPEGAGRLRLGMQGLASGVYLIDLEVQDGPARLGRRTLKLALLQ